MMLTAKFLAVLAAISAVAAAPVANQAVAKRAAEGQADIDTVILNYALTLEVSLQSRLDSLQRRRARQTHRWCSAARAPLTTRASTAPRERVLQAAALGRRLQEGRLQVGRAQALPADQRARGLARQVPHHRSRRQGCRCLRVQLWRHLEAGYVRRYQHSSRGCGCLCIPRRRGQHHQPRACRLTAELTLTSSLSGGGVGVGPNASFLTTAS